MKSSDQPTKIVLPFANGAGDNYIRTVPVDSQIGVTNGAASYTDGFPPDTFVPEAAGGYPPDGRDFNGLLNIISGWARWVAAAGLTVYDSVFSTSIGGYPSGAVLIKADSSGLWISTVDDNTTDPDSDGAGWATLSLSESTADGRYAKLAGLNTQAFSVAAATTSAQAVNLGQFVNLLSSNGYAKLPGGLIIQWGSAEAPANATSVAFNFPITFPTAIFQIVASSTTPNPTASGGDNYGAFYISTSQYKVYADSAAGTVVWVAIGH